jgi:hypothetical protein
VYWSLTNLAAPGRHPIIPRDSHWQPIEHDRTTDGKVLLAGEQQHRVSPCGDDYFSAEVKQYLGLRSERVPHRTSATRLRRSR